MPTINTYLTFDGQTEEAFTFYKSVFGVEFEMISYFKDIPDCEDLPPEQEKRVLHVALPIGGNTLMGSDSMPGVGPEVTVGTHASISIQADSKEQADEYFGKLSEGGTVLMPLEDAFWNAYFGMCKDKFGVQWMVNFDYGE